MNILKAPVLANHQYKSIIRLFDHCHVATGDAFNLSRTKKQFQAEFGIAATGFIEVDGYSYSRQEVFEEIERPDFPARLRYHEQLWKSPQLLSLLENNTTDIDALEGEFKPFWQNQEFDAFISPYLAGPFNHLCRSLLSQLRLVEMGRFLNYESFIQPADRQEAFRSLHQFLEENIRLLRNVTRENYKLMRPKIAHWIDTDWFVMFNRLPHEFEDEKNDIIVRLINLGVAIQKTNKRDCRKTSDQLISLMETPENLRTTIVSNHAIYNQSSSWSFSWRGGFGIVWIIFMLIRIVASDGCNDSKPTYREIPMNLIQYDTSIKGVFSTDSAGRLHLDTTKFRKFKEINKNK